MGTRRGQQGAYYTSTSPRNWCRGTLLKEDMLCWLIFLSFVLFFCLIFDKNSIKKILSVKETKGN
jgi:hypothetical protein